MNSSAFASDSAVALLAVLALAGFAEDDITLIAPEDHPTKGNLVVRYRGKSHGRPTRPRRIA